MLRGLWSRYNCCLAKYPITTKALTSGTLGFIGDGLAQRIEHSSFNSIEKDELESQSFSWNFQRSAVYGSYGLFFVGPLSHGWYLVLEKLGHRQIRSFPLAVSPRLPFASHILAVKKTLIDQTLGATTFTALFFTMTGFLKGQNISEVQQKLRQEYWNTLVLNWTIWPAAMLINFGLIPLDKRVLFANCVGLGWGTYLSIVSNRKVKSVEKNPPNPCLKT